MPYIPQKNQVHLSLIVLIIIWNINDLNTTILLKIILDILVTAWEINDIEIGIQGRKLSLFTDNLIIHVEDMMESYEN